MEILTERFGRIGPFVIVVAIMVLIFANREMALRNAERQQQSFVQEFSHLPPGERMIKVDQAMDAWWSLCGGYPECSAFGGSASSGRP